MKKVTLILAITAVAMAFTSCKKTEDENPKPDFDASAWANLGNTIFNDQDTLIMGGGGHTHPVDSVAVVHNYNLKAK